MQNMYGWNTISAHVQIKCALVSPECLVFTGSKILFKFCFSLPWMYSYILTTIYIYICLNISWWINNSFSFTLFSRLKKYFCQVSLYKAMFFMLLAMRGGALLFAQASPTHVLHYINVIFRNWVGIHKRVSKNTRFFRWLETFVTQICVRQIVSTSTNIHLVIHHSSYAIFIKIKMKFSMQCTFQVIYKIGKRTL